MTRASRFSRHSQLFQASTLLLIITLAGGAHANDFALSLTDDSAKGQFNFSQASDELAFGVGYTYHTGARNIANIDFHAQGRTALGNVPATVGVGLRTMYFRDSPIEGGALAPGGYISLNIPDFPGLSLNGSLHGSPTVLSFGDSEGMINFESTVSYRVIRNAEFFVGYRFVNTQLDDGRDKARLDEGFLGGMRILF